MLRVEVVLAAVCPRCGGERSQDARECVHQVESSKSARSGSGHEIAVEIESRSRAHKAVLC